MIVTLRCLLVDDGLDFLHTARTLLEQEGLQVVGVASTSADALVRAAELGPDVTLSTSTSARPTVSSWRGGWPAPEPRRRSPDPDLRERRGRSRRPDRGEPGHRVRAEADAVRRGDRGTGPRSWRRHAKVRHSWSTRPAPAPHGGLGLHGGAGPSALSPSVPVELAHHGPAAAHAGPTQLAPYLTSGPHGLQPAMAITSRPGGPRYRLGGSLTTAGAPCRPWLPAPPPGIAMLRTTVAAIAGPASDGGQPC
jgi:hypothetical protein